MHRQQMQRFQRHAGAGIETSCDETGVAVYDGDDGLVGHAVYSQIALHADFGGVVPELASRDHVRRLAPMIGDLLRDTGLDAAADRRCRLHGGQGWLGAVGRCRVRAQPGMGLGVPAVGIHHMEGHPAGPDARDDPPSFPFVALLVSGGHTQLVRVGAVGDYELLGESLDDAAGEAFDKTAKLLGLGYPGGLALAALARRRP